MNKPTVLYMPIHYILDAENSGSEFSWSYEIYKYISNSRVIDAFFITGGIRNISDSSVINCNVFDPVKLNLTTFKVINFYLKIFLLARIEMKKRRIDIIHHVLPFSDNSFNLIALFSNVKFIVGPVQPALLFRDEDVDVKDSLGFQKTNNKIFSLLTNELILNLIKPLLNFLSIKTLKKAKKIIVVSNDAKKTLLKRGVTEEKIIIIPPGIDTAKFKMTDFEKKNKNKIEILVACHLRKRKGVDLIILALSQVLKKHKKVHLTIIGDGPQKNSLKELTDKLSLRSYIDFEGFISQKEISKYYSNAHIFVNMSKAEGFATVCLEAMSSGLAVISSRVGGFKDAIEDGHDGFIVGQGDYKSLASRITQLIEEPELIKKFGEKARIKVEKQYDWKDRIIPQYLKLYFSLYD